MNQCFTEIQSEEGNCCCNFTQSSKTANPEGFKIKRLQNIGDGSSNAGCFGTFHYFMQCYDEGIHPADSGLIPLIILTIICIVLCACVFYLCRKVKKLEEQVEKNKLKQIQIGPCERTGEVVTKDE